MHTYQIGSDVFEFEDVTFRQLPLLNRAASSNGDIVDLTRVFPNVEKDDLMSVFTVARTLGSGEDPDELTAVLAEIPSERLPMVVAASRPFKNVYLTDILEDELAVRNKPTACGIRRSNPMSKVTTGVIVLGTGSSAAAPRRSLATAQSARTGSASTGPTGYSPRGPTRPVMKSAGLTGYSPRGPTRPGPTPTREYTSPVRTQLAPIPEESPRGAYETAPSRYGRQNLTSVRGQPRAVSDQVPRNVSYRPYNPLE